MILGLSTATFTTLHVIISLIAIVSGLIVVGGMLGANRLPGWTALFLFTTILTSASGFLFPIKTVTPALIVGAVSLLLLVVALIALYGKHIAGTWRWIYVITAITALWFNVVVLIVQSFQKLGPLKALAPTQSEPPFLITQVVAMLLFIVLGIVAVIRFRPAPSPS